MFVSVVVFLDGVLTAPRILIAVGLITFLVAFLGCCGALRDSRCLLFLYIIALSFVLVLQIVAVITAYTKRVDLGDNIKTKMITSIERFDKNKYNGVTSTWEFVQMDFHCCGVESYTDWSQRYPPAGNDTDEITVPDSCCIGHGGDESKQCPPPVEGSNNVTIPSSEADQLLFSKGCYVRMVAEINDHIGSVGGVALGVALLQIIGIMFACLLYREARGRYETV